jgi:hypothetical protein
MIWITGAGVLGQKKLLNTTVALGRQVDTLRLIEHYLT